MKISHESKNVYVNLNAAAEEKTKSGKTQESRTVFAGSLRGMQQTGLFGKQDENDPVAARKAEAVKKAVKLVTDTWEGEQALDDSIAESKQRMEELEEDSAELLQQKAEYEEKIRQYEEDPNLSEEEKAEVTASLKEAAADCQKKVDANTNALAAGRRSMQDVQLERLKTHDMVDASKAEEKALLAASKDAAYGMLQEGVDQIDEKIEKIVEEAEKKKEEKEEEQEAEEAREEREAAYAGNAQGAAGAKQTVRDDITGEIPDNEKLQRQIRKLLDEELLTEDDLMGVMVDSLI